MKITVYADWKQVADSHPNKWTLKISTYFAIVVALGDSDASEWWWMTFDSAPEVDASEIVFGKGQTSNRDAAQKAAEHAISARVSKMQHPSRTLAGLISANADNDNDDNNEWSKR